MPSKKATPRLSKKAHQAREKNGKRAATSNSRERQDERQNQANGRGSGEGISGLHRGDGHPTGR